MYAFELFQAGIEGLAYLLKDRVGDIEEPVRAKLRVSHGGSVIDPLVAEKLLARTTTPAGKLEILQAESTTRWER